MIRHNNGICSILKGSVWSCQRPLLIINSENLVWRAIKILPLWIIKKGKLLGLVSSLMETLKETASSWKWNAYQLFIILWLLILDKVLFELELGIIWFIKKYFLFIYTIPCESVITNIKNKMKSTIWNDISTQNIYQSISSMPREIFWILIGGHIVRDWLWLPILLYSLS